MKQIKFFMIVSIAILVGISCTNDDDYVLSNSNNTMVQEHGFTAIRDVNFEKFLIAEGMDDIQDGQVRTASISSIKQLEISNERITNLEGLEGFTDLRWLKVSAPIEEINLSKNAKITYLSISLSTIYNLNLTNNPELIEVYISGMNIETLDLTNNLQLKHLDVSNCKLKNIDLSKNIELTHLYVQNNDIKEVLDFSNNELLAEMNATANSNLSCITIGGNSKTLEHANSGIGRFGEWRKEPFVHYNNSCKP